MYKLDCCLAIYYCLVLSSGVLDSTEIHNTSRVFLRSFDRAVRLRQMHEKNKMKINKDGLDDFYQLNMMGDPRILSTPAVCEYSNAKPRRE